MTDFDTITDDFDATDLSPATDPVRILNLRKEDTGEHFSLTFVNDEALAIFVQALCESEDEIMVSLEEPVFN